MTDPTAGFDAIDYWERRHVALAGDLRNVGNRGLTVEQNRDLITNKANLACHALGRHGVPRGARVLDAGCGAGVFTELLQGAGFSMTGVDCSPSAIADARSRGTATYDVAALCDYRPEALFDAVLCLDVLFHVIDQDEWARSVANLVSCAKPDGLVMIIENFDHARLSPAPHVRWRRREDYAAVLTRAGYGFIDEVPFQYPHEGANKVLAVAQRIG